MLAARAGVFWRATGYLGRVTDPVLVEVVRGGLVESVHHARAVVVEPSGRTWAVGDVEAPVYARSAWKPAQAIAMLREGLDVEGADLALSAASHFGEDFHIAGVRRILQGAGLEESALQNTPDLPIGQAARTDWIRAGLAAASIAQNCSGKHAAMLRTCVRAGLPTESYLSPAHRLQSAIRGVIAELSHEPVPEPTVDGCGAPAFATSLVGLARTFGTVASATAGPAAQVANAYREHPEYASGTGADDALLQGAVPGLICKAGAEGVLAAGLPDGTGIALKIMDGASRGRRELLVALLRQVGVDAPGLAGLATSPVLGHGEPVGTVRAVRLP